MASSSVDENGIHKDQGQLDYTFTLSDDSVEHICKQSANMQVTPSAFINHILAIKADKHDMVQQSLTQYTDASLTRRCAQLIIENQRLAAMDYENRILLGKTVNLKAIEWENKRLRKELSTMRERLNVQNGETLAIREGADLSNHLANGYPITHVAIEEIDSVV